MPLEYRSGINKDAFDFLLRAAPFSAAALEAVEMLAGYMRLVAEQDVRAAGLIVQRQRKQSKDGTKAKQPSKAASKSKRLAK